MEKSRVSCCVPTTLMSKLPALSSPRDGSHGRLVFGPPHPQGQQAEQVERGHHSGEGAGGGGRTAQGNTQRPIREHGGGRKPRGQQGSSSEVWGSGWGHEGEGNLKRGHDSMKSSPVVMCTNLRLSFCTNQPTDQPLSIGDQQQPSERCSNL